MASQTRLTGAVVFFIILLFSYTPLLDEVKAIATAEGASSMAKFVAAIFPITWILFIVLDLGMLVFMVMKGV